VLSACSVVLYSTILVAVPVEGCTRKVLELCYSGIIMVLP
jgi:hypothetical protein